MNREQLEGLVRALLSAIGGYAAGMGMIDNATMLQLVGLGTSVAVAFWSYKTNQTGKVNGVPEVRVVPATDSQPPVMVNK